MNEADQETTARGGLGIQWQRIVPGLMIVNRGGCVVAPCKMSAHGWVSADENGSLTLCTQGGVAAGKALGMTKTGSGDCEPQFDFSLSSPLDSTRRVSASNCLFKAGREDM